MKKVGFIGLGNMGLPMANNIIKAGIEVKAFDLSADAMRRSEELGMATKNHASEVTENIDAIITMLPNVNAVENIYLKENLIEQISQNTIVIESSTINPEVSIKVSKKATEMNISMLDAPVSGGVKGAESGTLTFRSPNDTRSAAFAKFVMGVTKPFAKFKPINIATNISKTATTIKIIINVICKPSFLFSTLL